MKSIKYIAILSAFLVAFFIWQFVSVAMEHGLPRYSLYYIASIIEIVLGYLTIRFVGTPLGKRYPRLMLLIYGLCFGLPIALFYLKIGILWQVGGSQLWYMLSTFIFSLVRIIKQRSTGTDNVSILGDVEQLENLSKGLILFVLIMAIIFVPLLIFIFLMLTVLP